MRSWWRHWNLDTELEEAGEGGADVGADGGAEGTAARIGAAAAAAAAGRKARPGGGVAEPPPGWGDRVVADWEQSLQVGCDGCIGGQVYA